MRRATKVDANQAEIVAALRKAGVSVWVTSAVGQGFPDLVAGYRGITYAFECKRPRAPGQPAGELTDDQRLFFLEWRGQAAIVRSAAEALRVVGATV